MSQTPQIPALAGCSEETGRKSGRQRCEIVAGCGVCCKGDKRPSQRVAEGGSFPEWGVCCEARRLGESSSGVGWCRCKGPGAREAWLEGRGWGQVREGSPFYHPAPKDDRGPADMGGFHIGAKYPHSGVQPRTGDEPGWEVCTTQAALRDHPPTPSPGWGVPRPRTVS